ncbi:MAG: AMP-binding protein [Bacteroidales bacterium]|nr:AMP-binding protein [Bacteroidales bacterium]
MFLTDKEGIAIKSETQNVSFQQLHSKIHYFAQKYKIKEGDRVVVFSENRIGWAFAFYSIWENKGIALPVDHLSTSKELAYILNDSKPATIFYSMSQVEVLSEALKHVDFHIDLLTIEDYENQEIDEINKPTREASFDETAVIIYTSGTTGSPKGVMLSFGNIHANIHAVSDLVKIYSSEQRVMILLPLHHVFPLIGTLVAPLAVGATVAIAPSMASESIIKTLNDHQITMIVGVPRLYSAIRKGIVDKIEKSFVAKTLFRLATFVNSQKFSKTIFKTVHKKFGGHIQFMISGGAALDPIVAKDFKALGFELLEGFGMTETSPMITFTRPGTVTIGSAGQALPGTELMIKDGEVVTKGPHVMKGYYNKPEETKQVIIDGWMHTGDLGRLDEKGFLYITGRKKEIIVLSNGKNINPIEIEFQLENAMPFIKELAVFEKDDKLQLAIVPDRLKVQELNIVNLSETIKAYLMDQYNQSVSTYKRVFKFHILNDDLPKTRLGKVQRFKLAESISNSDKPKIKQNDLNTEEYRLIKGHIEEEKNIQVFPDDHLEIDLSLDSLDKVSLQVFIENTFGVNINAERIAEHETIRKLSEFVQRMKTKIQIDKINWGDIIKEKVNIRLPKSDFSLYLIVKTLKVFFKAYFRYRIEGQEHIPHNEPCIIAPNHQSYLDGMFVASAFSGKTLMKSFFYTKAKHVRSSFLRKFADRNNIIVVDINENLKQSIQSLAVALKKGKNIVIFPEGTRSTSNNMGEFKKTFAILSKELNVPVVPVAISGAHQILPRGSRFPRPFKKVCVEFLSPIMPNGHTYLSLTEKTKEIIHQNLKLLSV